MYGPTMTPAEFAAAAAALRAEIGATVTTSGGNDNRRAVRKLLTRAGVPSAAASLATKAELQRALDGDHMILAVLCRDEDETAEEIPAPAPAPAKPTAQTQPTQPTAQPRPADTDAAAQLAALLARLAGGGAAVPADLLDRVTALEAARVIVEGLSCAAMDTANAAAELAKAAIDAAGAGLRVTVTRPDAVEVKIDGAHDALPDVLRWLSADVPVYLVGPAGSGKTTLAQQCAEALGCDFYFSGAVVGAHLLTGYMTPAGVYVSTAFRQWWNKGGVFLLDEIDGSDPRAIVAVNAMLDLAARPLVTWPDGVTSKAHPDCRLIVSANTVGAGATSEYVGRFRLDAASLSRFAQVAVDYSAKVEGAIAAAAGLPEWLELVRAARAAAANTGAKLVIGTRAVKAGCAGLLAGLTVGQCCDALIWPTADEATRSKLKSALQNAAEAAKKAAQRVRAAGGAA